MDKVRHFENLKFGPNFFLIGFSLISFTLEIGPEPYP